MKIGDKQQIDPIFNLRAEILKPYCESKAFKAKVRASNLAKAIAKFERELAAKEIYEADTDIISFSL